MPSLIFSIGSFGRVRIAKKKGTDRYVAVKILKKAEIIKLKQVDHIMNETNILGQITHPFIVRILFKVIINHVDQYGWVHTR